MLLLLSPLYICISSAQPYAIFLHKDIKQLASFSTAVINRASISSGVLFSVSPNFATVLLHISLLFLSNWSKLNLHIKSLNTSHEISCDMNVWRMSFSLCVPLPVLLSLNFGVLNSRVTMGILVMQLTVLAKLSFCTSVFQAINCVTSMRHMRLISLMHLID